MKRTKTSRNGKGRVFLGVAILFLLNSCLVVENTSDLWKVAYIDKRLDGVWLFDGQDKSEFQDSKLSFKLKEAQRSYQFTFDNNERSEMDLEARSVKIGKNEFILIKSRDFVNSLKKLNIVASGPTEKSDAAEFGILLRYEIKNKRLFVFELVDYSYLHNSIKKGVMKGILPELKHDGNKITLGLTYVHIGSVKDGTIVKVINNMCEEDKYWKKIEYQKE